MDKIKSMLHSAGGSKKEDESTYDEDSYSQTASHTGKLTGAGSHLSSATGNTGVYSCTNPKPSYGAAEQELTLETDTTSSGPAPTATGPRISDLTNKADPRVDSNNNQGTTTGAESDFANKAAGTAWSSHNQNAPGAFPEEDTSNPYAASSIDPRVDKVPRTHDTSAETGPTTSTTGSSLGQPTGTGLGQSTDTPSSFDESGSTGRTGPSSGLNEPSVAAQTPDTSSGLTGGSKYGNTAGTGGYDNTTSQSSVPPTDSTSGTSNNQSMMGRALGAVGLGGAAAKADTQTPSTTTGTDSYDTPAQSGEIPSHHRKESIPTTAYPSGTLDSPRAVAPPVGASADERGADSTGLAAIGQTSTYGSHYLGSGEPTSSVIDPNSSDPNTFRKPETSHLGRDVGIGAGLGATGVGAASAYDGNRDQSSIGSGLQSDAPTSSTGGEHTTFYDAATTGHQPGLTSSGAGSTGQSQGYGTTSSEVPTTGSSQEYGTAPDRHPGRDAAALGAGSGAGALGAGAYESEKYGGSQDTNTGASTGYGSTTGNTTGAPGYHTTSTTAGDQTASQPYDQTGDRHLGRDTGVAGAGAGTLGAGAYEYEKHRGQQDATTDPSTGYGSTSGNTTGTSAYQTTPATTGYQTTSQPYDQTGDRHLGRDAAVAGTGAGAAGVGAHEYSKHEAKEAEKEQKVHDKAEGKEEKKLEKSERQQEKHREKELAKEEKAHEPHSHRKEEEAGVAAAGTGAVGAHEYDEHEREKKPSLMQRILHPRSSKAAAQDETSGLAASDAADSRAFHEHGDAGSRPASNTTPAGYAPAPTKGYASQVTGGTGTTALAQGEGTPSGSHATALGNVMESRDPTVRDGSAPNYPTEQGQVTGGTGYGETPSSGYASQATGGAGDPVDPGNAGGEALGGHHHGLQGSGLTRESMTGEESTGHQFGEITDHKR